MKRCPQCSAEYEDHVEFCFVDGSELPADSIKAAPAPAAPAPMAPPPPRRTSRSILPYLLVLALVSIVVLFGGAATAWMLLREPATATSPQIPSPAPPTPSVIPPPAPTVVPVIKIEFTSSPSEAEVWENETRLCVTPCTVDHPDYSPLPRAFSLRKSGHPDTPVQLTDPNVGQDVVLRVRPVPSAPRPARPRPRPKPDLATER